MTGGYADFQPAVGEGLAPPGRTLLYHNRKVRRSRSNCECAEPFCLLGPLCRRAGPLSAFGHFDPQGPQPRRGKQGRRGRDPSTSASHSLRMTGRGAAISSSSKLESQNRKRKQALKPWGSKACFLFILLLPGLPSWPGAFRPFGRPCSAR